jgi:hypothetical protein
MTRTSGPLFDGRVAGGQTVDRASRRGLRRALYLRCVQRRRFDLVVAECLRCHSEPGRPLVANGGEESAFAPFVLVCKADPSL